MAAAPRTAETVLVTTHDLPLAGRLRSGFRHGGYRVELLTRGEAVAVATEPALLVFTGGGGTEDAARQTGEARELGIPVFAVAAPGEELPESVKAAFAAPADAEEIVLVGTRAIERRRLRRATGIVGETDAMTEVLERIVQIAPVDVTVLVTGESGTGKELVARGIHALSRRRHKAFIPVNVAALSETLLESELFGHEKGAFTGAIDTRKGLFELASGGTIFLDEIGEMAPHTQTRLLRVLEQQEFHRVGGQRLIKVNVRILAATNRRLQDLVAEGGFRRDLYYRLNVLSISLPPLRDRRDDIPRLVDAFVRDAGERHDRGPFRGISREAMDILERHRWPGNVRELRNLVESMVVLAPGREIRAEDIPLDVRRGETGGALVPAAEAGAGPSWMGAGPGLAGDHSTLRPQLAFIFRTMLEMKDDLDYLRREFEEFQGGAREGRVLASLPPRSEVAEARAASDAAADADAESVRPPVGEERAAVPAPAAAPSGTEAAPSGAEADPSGDADPDAEADADAVAYRPGMTLEDMEREVVLAVLEAADWNRRRAAEALGIGERTLYRKVKQFELARDRADPASDHGAPTADAPPG